MRKPLLLLLGLLLIFILSYFCFTGKSEGIKSDLLTKAQTAYSEKSMNWVSSEIKGQNLESTRILTLTGTANSLSAKEEAEKIAQSIEGITSIDNQIIIQSASEPTSISETVASADSTNIIATPNPYILSVKKSEDKKIILSGYVSSKEEHIALIDKANTIYGETNVIDELKEAPNAPTAWNESVILGLDKLSTMDYGHFDMKDETFNFEGFVGTEEDKNSLLDGLKSNLASNYVDTYNIQSPKIKTVKDLALGCQEEFKRYLSAEKINFAYDKALIKKESYSLLSKLIEVAKSCPDSKLVIEGHTDSDGSKKYNQKLSEKRANAVKIYLEKHGISKKRLESIGYGELQPIADNKTEAGKKENRRIEINVKGVK